MSMNDDERAFAASRLEAWKAALAVFAKGGAELDQLRPPRWRWRTADGMVLATLNEPGTRTQASVAIEAPGTNSAWTGLLVLPREQALATAAALTTGDRGFDDAVIVFCPELAAHGLFDVATRALVRAVVAGGAVVLDGAVCLEANAAPLASDIGPLLGQMLALRAVLGRVGLEAARRRVVDIAADDPVREVRTRYDGLARTPVFARYAVEREARRGLSTGDTSSTLGSQVADARLPVALRRAALQRLLAKDPLEKIAALHEVRWRELAGDDELAAMLAVALRRHDEAAAERPAGHARAGLFITRAIFGDSGGAPSVVARALVPLLPHEATYGGRLPLVELARHSDPKVANAARDRFVASFPDMASIVSAIETGPTSNDLVAWPELARAVLLRACDVVVKRKHHTAEAAAARRVVRAIVSDLREPTGDNEWPAEALALPCVRSHLDAHDLDGGPFLVTLVAHPSEALRRAALAALFDLQPTTAFEEAVTLRARPADIVAAALDRRPRFGAHYLASCFPKSPDDGSMLSFLEAIEQVGDATQAPLVASLLDERSPTLVCAALAALGAMADSVMLPRIEPLTSGFFRDGQIKAAARDAVTAIAKRAAARGSLTLAEGGGLALAKVESEAAHDGPDTDVDRARPKHEQ